MPIGLHHVEVNVSNLSVSIDFWGWLLSLLGFEPYQTWEDGRSYRSGSTYIVFVQAEDAYRAEPLHRKRPGLNHLAFWGASKELVLELPDRLRERGIRVLYDDRNPGELGAPSEWSVFFEDPDRIKVEVVAPELS